MARTTVPSGSFAGGVTTVPNDGGASSWTSLLLRDAFLHADTNGVLDTTAQPTGPIAFTDVDIKASPGGDYSAPEDAAVWFFEMGRTWSVHSVAAIMEALKVTLGPGDSSGVTAGVFFSDGTTFGTNNFFGIQMLFDSAVREVAGWAKIGAGATAYTRESGPDNTSWGAVGRFCRGGSGGVDHWVNGLEATAEVYSNNQQAIQANITDQPADGATLYWGVFIGRTNTAGAVTLGVEAKSYFDPGPEEGVNL